MTEAEHQLLQRLVGAAWPLPVQIAFAAAFIVGCAVWPLVYYRALDPTLRALLGRKIGAHVVWVRRHSAEYVTPFESGFARYARWSWGIADPAQRTWHADGITLVASLVVVNILAGMLPFYLLLGVFLGLHGLSYVTFMPCVLAAMLLYSWRWDGRRQVTGTGVENV